MHHNVNMQLSVKTSTQPCGMQLDVQCIVQFSDLFTACWWRGVLYTPEVLSTPDLAPPMRMCTSKSETLAKKAMNKACTGT